MGGGQHTKKLDLESLAALSVWIDDSTLKEKKNLASYFTILGRLTDITATYLEQEYQIWYKEEKRL